MIQGILATLAVGTVVIVCITFGYLYHVASSVIELFDEEIFNLEDDEL